VKTAIKVIGGLLGVVLLIVLGLGIYIYATAITPGRPVGFQVIKADDPGHEPIAVGVWYPTSAKPGFTLLGSRGAQLAFGGPVAGERLPLIVISHGTGGSAMSHADTAIALAAKGFVVAAPTHVGDNIEDDSDVGKPDWLLNRSRQVSRVIDAALGSWRDRNHLDPRRVGVFGFSAGGTTALIDVGGVPDLSRIATQCAGHPEFVCNILRPADYRGMKPLPWRSDSRIRAAVIAAPGLGFTFEPDGLSRVTVPVQLWAGSADETEPIATNAGIVQKLLPKPAELHVVPGAVHYSFLTPCGLIGPPQLCRDPKGFDRSRFHEKFNRSVAGFFEANLQPPAGGQPIAR
jgi:predicted dienelactone hydrolase